MKIEKETVQYIKNVIQTAKLLDIEDVCIEYDIIRGMATDQGSFILHSNNLPDLPFDAMGITRLPALLGRLDLTQEGPNSSVDAKINDGIVNSLTLKCPGTKVGFNCANPSSINAPRKINDKPVHNFHISEDAINMISRGFTTMKSDVLTIISNDDGVSIEMKDVNNDTFSQLVTNEIEILNGDSNLFVFKYPAKKLINLLKHTGETNIIVREQGTLNVEVNELDIIIAPKV